MAKNHKLVEVKIFRGVYVTAEGEAKAGQTVKVDADEAARLKALGVVQPDNYVPPEEVQDGQVKISPNDGPTVATVAVVTP